MLRLDHRPARACEHHSFLSLVLTLVIAALLLGAIGCKEAAKDLYNDPESAVRMPTPSVRDLMLTVVSEPFFTPAGRRIVICKSDASSMIYPVIMADSFTTRIGDHLVVEEIQYRVISGRALSPYRDPEFDYVAKRHVMPGEARVNQAQY